MDKRNGLMFILLGGLIGSFWTFVVFGIKQAPEPITVTTVEHARAAMRRCVMDEGGHPKLVTVWSDSVAGEERQALSYEITCLK